MSGSKAWDWQLDVAGVPGDDGTLELEGSVSGIGGDSSYSLANLSISHSILG